MIVASKHLLLPALYYKIKKRKIDNLFNIEFIEYLKYIYNINLNRNKKIIEEIEELSKY